MKDRNYANPQLLASPEEVKERLGDESQLVIDVRSTADYVRGHIPGAVHFDIYGISLNDTRPEPLSAFMWMVSYLLAHRGVAYDKSVVFYQENSGFKSARGFWFLEYFGLQEVRVLDGGFNAWTAKSFPVSHDPVDPKPTQFASEHPIADRIASADDILSRMGDPNVCILDTRSDDEYAGKMVRAKRGGAIPGAIHIEWTNNLDEQGCYKSASELKAMYEDRGITSEKHIIPYCQGGYRSAHTYLALRLIGYPNVRNYVGSWKEWGDMEELPIEVPSTP